MLVQLINLMQGLQSSVVRRVLLGAAALLVANSAWAEQPLLSEAGAALEDGLQSQLQVSTAQLTDPNAIRVLLSPQLDTVLVAQMAGHIDELNVSLGAKVSKGQPLVVFNCAEANARMRIAQAERESARENMSVKNNLRRLNAAGEYEVAIARAELRRADSTVALNHAQMAHCQVLAPFAGRVVKVHVKPHQGVNSGDTLLELVSSEPVKIRLNVPSMLLRDVQVGSAFTVSVNETGRSYAAKITAINARIDAVSHSVEMEGRFDEDVAELLPGMSGIARFTSSRQE